MLHCYASRAITVIQPRPTFVFIYALFSITIAGCPPAPLDICAPPSDLQVSEIICPESCKQLESAQQQITLDLLGSSRLTTTIFNDSHTDNLATATVAPRGIITINLDFCNTCCCNISITGMQLQLGDFTLGDKLVNNASIGRAKPTDTPINGNAVRLRSSWLKSLRIDLRSPRIALESAHLDFHVPRIVSLGAPFGEHE